MSTATMERATPLTAIGELEVIATFDSERGQDIFALNVGEGDIQSEAGTLRAILNSLKEDDVNRLVKLSLCLYSRQFAAPEWLLKSKGKYYFAVENARYSKQFPSLAHAARFLVSKSTDDVKRMQVLVWEEVMRWYEGERPVRRGEDVLAEWHEVQTGKVNVPAIWTQPAMIISNEVVL